MHVFVPKERSAGETRVAATPETVKRLVQAGFRVVVEAGAGRDAHIGDDAFKSAGAEVPADAGASWSGADVVLKVAAPTVSEIDALKKGALVIALMSPFKNLRAVARLRDRQVTALAMELVPRISRAQTMDALSSQASIAGYKAVLLAAARLDKYFPLLMTAAGTVQPARVVVMGAGVAGLQAIATARRLGAVVEVSDIRPAVKEQVESLGGRFIELPMKESGEGQGGYAKEMSADFLEKQRSIVREHLVAADVVITTALIPGKPAPELVSEETVRDMRNGAVIVDLAVEQGGNCPLSKLNQEVVEHGVVILGHANLPATMPADASLLYARNVLALVKHVSEEGAIKLDLEDEIVQGALLTHDGEVRHAPTAERIEQAPPASHPPPRAAV